MQRQRGQRSQIGAHLECAVAKPRWASIAELSPGNSVGSRVSSSISPSVISGSLSQGEHVARYALNDATYMASGFVPWFETTIVLRVGSYPTNPISTGVS